MGSKRKAYIPKFLNTPEKWKKVITDTDTLEKFEAVVFKILDLEQDNEWGFIDSYRVIKRLEKELKETHNTVEYRIASLFAEVLLKYVTVCTGHIEEELE
jgi:hypothetical protein